jgi:hypothetical protein
VIGVREVRRGQGAGSEEMEVRRWKLEAELGAESGEPPKRASLPFYFYTQVAAITCQAVARVRRLDPNRHGGEQESREREQRAKMEVRDQKSDLRDQRSEI